MGCKWLIEVEIADIWIHDGCRLNEEYLADAIGTRFLADCELDGEIVVKFKKVPTESQIKQSVARHDKLVD